MNKKQILILIISPLIAAILALTRVYYSYNVWTFEGQNTIFQIRPGEGFSSINGRLKQKEMIHSAKLFYRYCQFYKCINKFKAGEFIIRNGFTTKNVLETLLNGKSLTLKVTIPEGKNLYEVAKILKSKNIIKNSSEFIKLAKKNTLLKKDHYKGKNLEGYLYPDTYSFSKNMPLKTVIMTMINQYKRQVKKLNFSKSSLTKFQVLTLASIVEKETGAAFERPKIAAVFLNRLKKKMRLQSDPTTIYGIYEHYNGNLRKKHLLERTDYNTYKIPALPIGPICNPGMDALKAVLNPAHHNYLYFVSKNDGTHVFSENYKQHRNAVNYFQKNPSMRKGKSWRNLHQNHK